MTEANRDLVSIKYTDASGTTRESITTKAAYEAGWRPQGLVQAVGSSSPGTTETVVSLGTTKVRGKTVPLSMSVSPALAAKLQSDTTPIYRTSSGIVTTDPIKAEGNKLPTSLTFINPTPTLLTKSPFYQAQGPVYEKKPEPRPTLTVGPYDVGKEKFMKGQIDYPVRIPWSTLSPLTLGMTSGMQGGFSPEAATVKLGHGVFFSEAQLKGAYYDVNYRPLFFWEDQLSRTIDIRNRELFNWQAATSRNFFTPVADIRYFGSELLTVGASVPKGFAEVWAAPVTTTAIVLGTKGLGEGLSIAAARVSPTAYAATTDAIGGVSATLMTGFFVSGLGERGPMGEPEPLIGLGSRYGSGMAYYSFDKVMNVGIGQIATEGRQFVSIKDIAANSVLSGKEQFFTASPTKHIEIFKSNKWSLPQGEVKLNSRYQGTESWAKITAAGNPELGISGRDVPFLDTRIEAWHATRGPLGAIVAEGSDYLAGLFTSPALSVNFLRIKGLGLFDYPKSIIETMTNIGGQYYPGLPLGANIKAQGIARIRPKQLLSNPSGRTRYMLPEWTDEGVIYVQGMKSEVEGMFKPGTKLKLIGEDFYSIYKGEKFRINQFEANPSGEWVVTEGGPILNTRTGQSFRPIDAPAIRSEAGWGKAIWSLSDVKVSPAPSSYSGTSFTGSLRSIAPKSYAIDSSLSSSLSSISYSPSRASISRGSVSRSSGSSSSFSISSITSSISRASSYSWRSTSSYSFRPSYSYSYSSSSITPPPPPAVLGGWSFGLLDLEGKKRKQKKLSFMPKYFSSVEANLLKIKGKMPSKLSVSTGLFMRPMLR